MPERFEMDGSLPPHGLVVAQTAAKQVVRALTSRSALVGCTERELADHASSVASQLGASGLWTPCTTRVGIGTMVAHPDFPMQDRRAAAGDYLIVDVAPSVEGWLGDYCETVVVGGSSDEEGIIDDCRRVQAAMIEQARPGMQANELFAVGAALADGAGLKLLDLLDNFGHSIGRTFAADGFIDADNDTPMWGAWTIEPHLGRRARGAKFEDMIWLPRYGPAVLV